MADFTVDVPIDFKGGSGGSSSGDTKELKKLNKGMKKLDKSIIGTIDVIEIASSLLSDVYKILQPLFKILSLLFMVFFLPFLPLMKGLIKVVASIIKGLVKLFNGEISFAEFIKSYVGPAIANLLKVIWDLILMLGKRWLEFFVAMFELIWEGVKWLGEQIGMFAMWIWEQFILPSWSWFASIPMWIWENILKPAWEFLSSVGAWIWYQILKPAWDFLKDVGSWIWNIISAPFRWLADKISSIWDWFKGLFGFGGGKANGGSVSGNTPYLIGERGPELFVPNKSGTIVPNNSLGGGSTVNINNPVVRNDGDIKKIANEVSKVLYRQNRGRFS